MGRSTEDFSRAVASGTLLLTDGGIETEIMFGTDYPMDPDLQVAAMRSISCVHTSVAAKALAGVSGSGRVRELKANGCCGTGSDHIAALARRIAGAA